MAARNPFASSDFFDPYAVQSRRAPRLSTGYYFLRNLLLVGAVAGGLVAAYRNDVLLDGARRAGQEQRYLAAEKFLVGSPGWGTPRSMEPVLKRTEGDEAASDAAPTPAATMTAPAPNAPARANGGSVSPVSLDSLPVLNTGAAAQASPAPERAVTPARVAAAPVARSFVSAAAAAPRPAPVEHGRVKAIKVTLDEDAPASRSSSPFVRHHTAPAAPPEPKPAPVAEKPTAPKLKPTDAHASDNPLLAAVRGAVRSRPPKSSVPAAQ